MSNSLKKYISTNKQDAILYKTNFLLKKAGNDAFEKSLAIEQIKDMLACIKDDTLLELYTKMIAASAGVKALSLSKNIKEAQEEKKKKAEVQLGEGERALPKWVNRDRLETIGFDWRVDEVSPDNTGLYFPTFGGHLVQLTNFVITPIVQIKSFIDADKRRITEMYNGRTKHVFELPSKALISPEAFESILLDEGYYHCKDGFTKSSLNKIKAYYTAHYPAGSELKKLGWQPEGFFAFSNLIYKDGIIRFDDYGLAVVDDKTYLSMGASNILQGIRSDEDLYKNDKALRYVESPIDFKEWTRLMGAAYEEKGMMGVSWCMLAANRDIVMARNNYCPIPYGYGVAGSGKSQFAASCTNFFTVNLRPFNLNQGTEYSFWEYMERFRNILAPYNEFDVQSIDEKRSRAFKGAADGEGRTKGTGIRNKATTQEINSTPLLNGQYLANIDGNSILSRCLPEKFHENPNRPAEQIKAFDLLKEYEQAGITSLSTVLFSHRDFIAANYQETYDQIRAQLKEDFTKENQSPLTRAMENYSTVLALMKLYAQKLELAFTYDQFYQYCKAQITRLNAMVGESNNLGEFWKLLEFLADSPDKGSIEPGWDYKIEVHTEVKSMIAEKGAKTNFTFDKPTRLLFLRFNNAYNAFAKEKKSVSGKPAIPPDTIKTYLIDQPYYIGTQSNGNFKSKRQGINKGTSSMVINYDMLVATNEINLERVEVDDSRELVILDGKVHIDAEMVDILGKVKMKFTIWQDLSYQKDGLQISNHVFTHCFSEGHTSLLFKLKRGADVRVTGMLAINTRKDPPMRNMEVQQLELIEAGYTPQFTPTPPVQYEIDHRTEDKQIF